MIVAAHTLPPVTTYEYVAPPRTIVANTKNRGSSNICRPRGQTVHPTTGCDRTCASRTVMAMTTVIGAVMCPPPGLLTTICWAIFDDGCGINRPLHMNSSTNDGNTNADNGFTNALVQNNIDDAVLDDDDDDDDISWLPLLVLLFSVPSIENSGGGDDDCRCRHGGS